MTDQVTQIGFGVNATAEAARAELAAERAAEARLAIAQDVAATLAALNTVTEARDEVVEAQVTVLASAGQVELDRQVTEAARDQASAAATTAVGSVETAASILTATAAAAAGTTYAATFAALSTAMSAAAEGARGEVLPGDPAEGVYTKLGNELVRTGDTAAQIAARLRTWVSLSGTAYSHALVDTDAAGRRRVLGAVTPAGTWKVKRIEADTVQVAQPEYAMLTTFQTLRDLSGAIPLVTPARRILGWIPRSLDALGGSGTSVALSELDRSIDMTGATDMSAKVKAAHDLAVSRGIRYVHVDGRPLCPSAERIGEVIWIGTGELVGNRRRVAPAHAGRARPELHTLIPSVHLPQFLARLQTATPENPLIWVITGDSWTEWRQAEGGAWLLPMLREELRRQLGPLANRVRVVDRGMGGMNWQHLTNPNMVVQSKDWAPDTAVPILDHLRLVAPDVVSIFLGQNDWQGDGGTGLSRASMVSAIAAIRAFPKTPEVVVGITAARRSEGTEDTNGTQAGQALYDRVAGGMRSYFRRVGIGYWDIAAHLNALRDGDLVTDPIYRRVETDVPITLPWTAATAAHDWSFDLTTNAGGAFWATGDEVLTITLGPRPGNVLRLDRDADTGRLAWACDARTGVNIVPRTVTDVAAVDGAGALRLSVTVRGGQLIVTTLDPLRGAALAIEADIEREGGEHAPTVSFGGGGSVAVTLARRCEGRPRMFMPQHTNREVYGVTDEGGNAAAHGTSRQWQDGVAEVIRAQRLGP